MHVDQVDVSADVVAGLVSSQFPDWADLAVLPISSTGTVNALFRLGEEIILRFPLRPHSTDRADLVLEQQRCTDLGPHVSVAVPEPVAIGEPGDGYAGHWTAFRWIPGETPDDTVADSPDLARDLADFVISLRAVDTGGRRWKGTGRGGPLSNLDRRVRDSLKLSENLVDTEALAAVWTRSTEAPEAGRHTWFHGDLMPGNLLVRRRRLHAVIDFETAGIGDPAADLIVAWNLLTASSREVFRSSLDVGDAAWERGRGWALAQAVIALPYYVDTNRAMADNNRRTLAALLD